MKTKFQSDYICAIIWFLIISVKIRYFARPYHQLEDAIVNYGLGLIVFLIFHYIVYKKKEIPYGLLKKIAIMFVNSIAVLAVSVFIIHVWHGEAPRWKEVIQSVYVFCVVICVECVVLYLTHVFDFDTFFINILLIVGLSMCVILPIRCWISWDDQAHYSNSQLVANGFDHDAMKADEDIYMTALDRSTYENYHKYLVNLDKEYIENVDSPFGFPGISFQVIVAYIPAALGTFIGRSLGLPYSIVFLVGRISNFMVYAILMYLSIRCLKSGKLILALYALIPTNLFLAVNYSYDYWVNALSVFAFCYFIGIIQDKERKIKIKDMFIIFGFMVLAFMPKSIYFPIILIYLFVGKDKFESKRDRRIYYIILIAAILFLICWFAIPYLSSGLGGDDTRGGDAVNSSGQIQFILSNMWAYIKILFNFLRYYWSFPTTRDYFNMWAYMGYVPYHKICVLLMLLAIVVDKEECDRNFNGILRKVVWIIIALGTSALVATALYVAFTPVGAEGISGCQPRYLLPLIFPTSYIIGSSIIAGPFKKIKGTVLNTLCVSCYAAIIVYAVWSVVIASYAL